MNCTIGKTKSFEDDEEIDYDVNVDRTKNSAADLRYDDLDNKLLDMGLCSACASNVAEFYVKRPTSACAKLAGKALAGNAAAIKQLVQFPDYCTWR